MLDYIIIFVGSWVIARYVVYNIIRSHFWGKEIFPITNLDMVRFGVWYNLSDYPIIKEKNDQYVLVSYKLWEIDYTYFDEYYFTGYWFSHKQYYRPKKWFIAYLNKLNILQDYNELSKQKKLLEDEITFLVKLSVVKK